MNISIPFLSSSSSSSSTEPFPNDLGFSRWETVALQESSPFFDVFFARPRGGKAPCSFLLKALKPRFCGSILGRALVERERFLGSLPCPRLAPIVDIVRPRAVSPFQARRGCVVFPIFPGRTLAQRLKDGEKFSSSLVSCVERQLKTALSAMNRRGWSVGDLAPERILLSDSARNADEPILTLTDFSSARRFGLASLFSDATRESTEEPTFDPHFEFPPDVFFDANASAEKDEEALKSLTRRLEATRFEAKNRILTPSASELLVA